MTSSNFETVSGGRILFWAGVGFMFGYVVLAFLLDDAAWLLGTLP